MFPCYLPLGLMMRSPQNRGPQWPVKALEICLRGGDKVSAGSIKSFCFSLNPPTAEDKHFFNEILSPSNSFVPLTNDQLGVLVLMMECCSFFFFNLFRTQMHLFSSRLVTEPPPIPHRRGSQVTWAVLISKCSTEFCFGLPTVAQPCVFVFICA